MIDVLFVLSKLRDVTSTGKTSHRTVNALFPANSKDELSDMIGTLRRNVEVLCYVCLAALLLLAGCSNPAGEETGSTAESSSTVVASSSNDNANSAGKSSMTMPLDPDKIVFLDDVASNSVGPENITELWFSDKDGNRIRLEDFHGKKNVVLVFTEGFNGALCPFCKTQTSRLVANYDKFVQLDTEVLVVYPGSKDHLDEFIEAAKGKDKEQVDRVPFPIVLDQEFLATTFFDIKSMHAHPSTFIIDKQLKVQLAYVGKDMTADRPSVKAMLDKIRSLN